MNKTIRVYKNGQMVDREITYIPLRYILSLSIILLETLEVLALLALVTIYVPYFYIAIIMTHVACVISIIASKDNPDYKIPWLVLVMALPVIGFMIYFMFYSRKLSKKYVKRYKLVEEVDMNYNKKSFEKLSKIDKIAQSQAYEICKLANSNLYQNTKMRYLESGEEMFKSLLDDLNQAEKFIFMEYFIIEEGIFWNTILEVLKQKAKTLVEVKIIYDDIGCMTTLPSNYYKTLRSYNIKAIPFSILKGQANSEFNNRSHRKITVIDNKVAYTGGINLADEYINEVKKYGHWKDGGLRLEGEAVGEFTKLFLIDYVTNNVKDKLNLSSYFPFHTVTSESFVVPFGDGPNPVYTHRVAKTIILNMLYQAKEFVYITSPYVVIDNELVQAIENTALRGVKVVLIVPHIPDKKLVFMMTKSNYRDFLLAGVEIYEYEPGFIHAKTYVSDNEYALVGTVNLDYRSLVHHFENGVWIYRDQAVFDIVNDIETTMMKSIKIELADVKTNLLTKVVQSLISIFTPLL